VASAVVQPGIYWVCHSFPQSTSVRMNSTTPRVYGYVWGVLNYPFAPLPSSMRAYSGNTQTSYGYNYFLVGRQPVLTSAPVSTTGVFVSTSASSSSSATSVSPTSSSTSQTATSSPATSQTTTTGQQATSLSTSSSQTTTTAASSTGDEDNSAYSVTLQFVVILIAVCLTWNQ